MERSQFSGNENVGPQSSPLHGVALPIASRYHQTGYDDTDQACLYDPNDKPRREIDDVAEISHAPQTTQSFNTCTKQSPRPNVAWKRQKREQRVMQQRAFRKEHENPFSKFQYDPNDAENNLDAITIESSSISGNGGSILPPETFAKVRHSIAAFQKGPTRLRSRKGVTHTRANGSTSQAIPSHMVLRMKGEDSCTTQPTNTFQDRLTHTTPFTIALTRKRRNTKCMTFTHTPRSLQCMSLSRLNHIGNPHGAVRNLLSCHTMLWVPKLSLNK
jgi:hypothetical protein